MPMGVARPICSYLFRHTRIRDYPKYEITLFLFAYGAYALAEYQELSGIMAIFSRLYRALQATTCQNQSDDGGGDLRGAVTVAESFVFMYVGWDFPGAAKTSSGVLPFFARAPSSRRDARAGGTTLLWCWPSSSVSGRILNVNPCRSCAI